MLTRSPSSSIAPAVGAWSPARIFRSVDLPAPFSPSSPWIEPASTARSTSSSASVPGKRFVMPRIRSSGTRSSGDVTP